ncbi:MAG: 50S ribosomal protein L32 [Deltaproteobacteria bacterium]|jgi:large subunit ribosomal protein L32|nr:50S ribosomal protein L32 [Deltaproteobacteria bacterium]
MTVPKRRQSKMKGRKRRTHYTAIVPTLSRCPKCREWIRPHHACPMCGLYRGRVIMTIRTKKVKEEDSGKGGGTQT